ncbi:MAG: RIP metalloprotease RseP [Alphaproteobacteria bacterium]
MIDWLANGLLPFLVVLTIVVFVHELGHYWVARRCGVHVETFSIGFGPEIFGWHDKNGTRWRVAWIPLGGYVKFFGDADAASAPDADRVAGMSSEEQAKSYHYKSPLQRMAIAVAGPVANFIFAVMVFWGLMVSYGEVQRAATVGSVSDGSAAQEAGLVIGDTVVAIDGDDIDTFADLHQYISLSGGQTMMFTIDRNGALRDLQVTPKRVMREDPFGNEMEGWLVGITSSSDYTVKRFGPIEGVGAASERVGGIITGTLKFVWQLVAGRESADQLGGPIRIATMSADVAQLGIASLVSFIALISVSIGLINLFPIPMLDGGHILLYTIELVRGKPLSDRALEMAYRVGFAMVGGLMIFATFNDLVYLKLFG